MDAPKYELRVLDESINSSDCADVSINTSGEYSTTVLVKLSTNQILQIHIGADYNWEPKISIHLTK